MPTLILTKNESLADVFRGQPEPVLCSSETFSTYAALLPRAGRSCSDVLPRLLVSLGIPAHKAGYRALLVAIPLYTRDPWQSLSKELYPAVADKTGCGDWRAVEFAIRSAIGQAWEQGDPAAWRQAFPGARRPPSNKAFIAALSEFVP